MNSIPRIFHFIFGLRPQTEEFHIAWYLCLKSCLDVNNPDTIYFHYLNEPHGAWWEKIKPELTLMPVSEIQASFDDTLYKNHQEGHFIQHADLEYAHQTDILRLQVLYQYGGVYADIDTLFVRPYPDRFYEFDCLMGREKEDIDPPTVCNAVILAKPNSVFIGTWLERMFEVFDGSWNRHSCIEPAILSEQLPDQIELVSPEWFYFFTYDTEALIALFGNIKDLPDNLCSIHMWNHLWWEEWRTDFIHFHGGLLTEDFIRKYDSTYNLIARQYLD